MLNGGGHAGRFAVLGLLHCSTGCPGGSLPRAAVPRSQSQHVRGGKGVTSAICVYRYHLRMPDSRTLPNLDLPE